MNKKMVRMMSTLALTLLTLASCNNEAKKVDEKVQTPTPQVGGMKIAYVEVD